MIKKIIASLTIFSILALLIVPVVSASDLRVNPGAITLEPGDTANVTVRDGDGVPVISDNLAVATVPEETVPTGGQVIITAVGEGTATIRIGESPDQVTVHVTVAQRVDPLIILTDIVELARNALALIVLLFIIVGAFFFVTAAGDDKKLEKGRKAIMFAVVGALIVALAQGFIIWADEFLR